MKSEDDVFTYYRQDVRNLGQRTNSLVLGHLALVISIALRYRSRGLSLSDLIQSGNEGLLLAAQKFDPERGFQFSTYASLWIRKTIGDAIKDEATSIRLPRYRTEQLARLREARSRLLLQQGGSEPLPSQLAQMLDCSLDLIHQLLRIEQRIQILSLDADLFDNETSLGEMLMADAQTEPENLSLQSLRHSQVSELLDKLTSEEREIILLRFCGDEERNCQEIARSLGRTPATIRRIEKRALEKLSYYTRERHLEDFL